MSVFFPSKWRSASPAWILVDWNNFGWEKVRENSTPLHQKCIIIIYTHSIGSTRLIEKPTVHIETALKKTYNGIIIFRSIKTAPLVFSVNLILSFIFLPTERQSSLGHSPHEDPQSHYDLPVNSHIPGHYDLPPVRRPPSPRRAHQWRSQQQSKFPSSSLLGWLQARARKERANSQLFSDNQSCRPPTEQRRGICPTEEPLFFFYSGCPHSPPFTSTLPLCGLKWYSPHRDRLVIQSREPAGCGEEGWTVATPAGLQLHSSPVGKIRHKTFCG